MLWRIRTTSFLAGVAVAGSLALYQLRQDLWDSHAILAAQVRCSPPRAALYRNTSGIQRALQLRREVGAA